jgi:mRNA interferase RelE/StbE
VSHGPYELVLTPPAIEAVRSGLPEGVAAAVIELLTGVLLKNPHRVGKQLRDLAGIHSVRRGTYRVLYRINEVQREVVVLRIEHRRDAYRPGRPLMPLTGPRPAAWMDLRRGAVSDRDEFLSAAFAL